MSFFDSHPALDRAPPASIWWRVFLPFACGYFLSFLYRSVNAVIFPHLVASVGLNASDLGLLTSLYFFAFALFQLPLGLLLDHFGPRRVEAALLLVAAAGALIFGLSANREGLMLGRALLGLGVSACLMAGFKAFTLWLPSQRLPAVNGWLMAAGGLGALAATAPVEVALELVGWRGLFLGLAGLTLAVAALIFLATPEPPRPAGGRATLADQLRGVAAIFRHRYFWRVAPLPVLSQSTFMAIQGLWAGPWLKDVAGLDQTAIATCLLLTAAAMTAGYLSIGTLAYRLSRVGVAPLKVAAGGIACFMAVQATLAAGYTGAVIPLWILFGFFGTAGSLSYAILSQAFPVALAGRVNTAINVLVFTAAFSIQWGVGVIVNQWPRAAGGYALEGYRTAFGLALALQAAALLWLALGGAHAGRRRAGGL